MNNAGFLNFVATGHALSHAKRKEDWLCNCFACRFTKEFKFLVQDENGTVKESTVADSLLVSLAQEGYYKPKV